MNLEFWSWANWLFTIFQQTPKAKMEIYHFIANTSISAETFIIDSSNEHFFISRFYCCFVEDVIVGANLFIIIGFMIPVEY